ncbi:MAG TPA: N-acetylneuraminate synthase family protein [Candidatus Methylacidiphilales bacterium]|nr:N-acetylneuraminate synthase family protein [Candidatus Methylacidiphilales bacterium]
MNHIIFEDLFVLEMANNHYGSLERALNIVREYSRIVRFNNVRAAIKFQLRDVDNFIHKDFRGRTDIRYVKKTLDTQMPHANFVALADAIKKAGCIPMATPFDERSVDFCVELALPIIKLASSDVNDWELIERIAKTRRPVICSTGGTSLKDLDDLVTFFGNRNIPLAINHCVSLYPCEDSDLELNQIDFLRRRYPHHVIGLSTHEYHDWDASLQIAYAKGARTFERHIDIDDGRPISPYCSLPSQIDSWFRAYNRAKTMCGGSGETRRNITDAEAKYLNSLVRGVYAKRDLPAGHVIRQESLGEDIYLAIPLQKGQISCRELMHGETLLQPIVKDQAVMIDAIDSAYAYHEELKKLIYERGI